MTDKLLSICIPTYNRSECLRECLDSVLISIGGHERDIEIVISDNASPDNTRDIVRAFQETHPWIRYHRNEQNIGGARNFRQVATLAQGENIWIFSDDDKMEANAVVRVLDNIRAGYGLTICNYSTWDKQFTVQLKKRGLFGDQDQSFEDMNELMKRFGLHLGYISSVVVKKALFLKLPNTEYEPFIEYGFPHVYSIYAGMAHEECRAMFIAAPIVRNRSGNSGNYDWYKYFVAGSSLIFNALLLKGYSSSAVRSAKHQVLRDCVIPRMFNTRLPGNSEENKKIKKLLFQYYKNNWLFWVVCVPLFFTPDFSLRYLKRIAVMTHALLIRMDAKKK